MDDELLAVVEKAILAREEEALLSDTKGA